MVLESTMICIDNSDYMRNGDFVPTRMQAQQDAVNLLCISKTRSNPENNVGLLTFSGKVNVLATLTTDAPKILAKLHTVEPGGDLNFLTGMRIAHLALKHRQGKHHKMRIVAFVASPVECDEKEIIKLAKRLKKEKVMVDIVSFGEDAINSSVLAAFIKTLNGKDAANSHLVTIPPGPNLADALVSSAVIQGEDGVGAVNVGSAGYEFGIDPNEDPELAMALRVSMEEQRQRQVEMSRRVVEQPGGEVAQSLPPVNEYATSEEAMLERALAMSMETEAGTEPAVATSRAGNRDLSAMTEEEQIEFAMRMSMQDLIDENKNAGPSGRVEDDVEPMDVDDPADMEDPEVLRSVLEELPGVDPHAGAGEAAGSSAKDKTKDHKGKK